MYTLTVYCGLMVLIGTSYCRVSKHKPTTQPPAFCKGYECPKYTVLQTYDDYELREYSPTNWVTAQMPSMSEPFWDDRSKTSAVFYKLFYYISGANDQKMKIDMTVPVITVHQENNASMAFMVPGQLASNIPQPTNPDVSIYKAPTSRVYVKSFSGFPYGFFGNKNYFKDNYESLTASLARDGQSYRTDMFFTASYNSPWDWFNRHNEVWLVQSNN